MTGQFLSTSGNVINPGLSFSSATGTGFYLAGTNQIGWTAAGTQGATFNSDLSVTWNGAATWAGAVTFNGVASFNSTSTFTGAMTLNATTYTFGVGAVAGWYQGIGALVDVAMLVDGGGSVITSGQKGQIHIPFPMTIQKWWVMADQSGSITVDVLRANNAVPSLSIVGTGNTPSLSSSQFSSAAPSGWTSTSLAKDDFIAFNVTGSPNTVTRISITLTCQRTG